MPVLCLNSHVTYGYVGNDAAGFCLRRMGVEAWLIDTVAFSNHPGYGSCTGRVTAPEDIRALVSGLMNRGVLDVCAGVLAGYLGSAAQGPEILHALDEVRALNPSALFVLDPIMGDAGPGLYVEPDIAAFLVKEAVPRAQVVTPNAFELGRIVGRPVTGRAEALSAAGEVLALGPRVVLVTSLPHGDSGVEVLAVTREGVWSLTVPRLDFPTAPNGAGDALAGLFTGHLVRGAGVREALEASANAVHAVLEATLAASRRELALIAAQDVIAAPPRRFAAEPVDRRPI